MLGTHDDTMQSKTGACVLFLDVIPLYRWIVLCRWYAFQPDGDLGSLGQSVPGALQPCVDLSHLNDPFQSHYLQALVAYVCGASTRTIQVRTRQSQPHAWRGGLKYHLVRLFWEGRGQWWPHLPPPLANCPLSWIHPRGWSRRACWVCWGRLCPPDTCCRGPGVSRSTDRSKTAGGLLERNPKNVTWAWNQRKKWPLYLLTSTARQSFSFLQEAKMVSEVANSKYQSLFFILKCQVGYRLF